MEYYARGRRKTGNVNTPYLDGAVVPSTRETELRRVECECSHGIEMAGGCISDYSFRMRALLLAKRAFRFPYFRPLFARYACILFLRFTLLLLVIVVHRCTFVQLERRTSRRPPLLSSIDGRARATSQAQP